MNAQLHYLINTGLCWLIVFVATGGYFITLKRTGQKWAFWMILMGGWALLAISNSLSVLGIGLGETYPRLIWLSSYVLVFASLVLLFIKLIKVLKAKGSGINKEVVKGKSI